MVMAAHWSSRSGRKSTRDRGRAVTAATNGVAYMLRLASPAARPHGRETPFEGHQDVCQQADQEKTQATEKVWSLAPSMRGSRAQRQGGEADQCCRERHQEAAEVAQTAHPPGVAHRARETGAPMGIISPTLIEIDEEHEHDGEADARRQARVSEPGDVEEETRSTTKMAMRPAVPVPSSPARGAGSGRPRSGRLRRLLRGFPGGGCIHQRTLRRECPVFPR